MLLKKFAVLLLTLICARLGLSQFSNECVENRSSSKYSPSCTLTTTNKVNVKTSCLENSVVRIEGDFEKLLINCTAKYPIDLDFDGITPTEAIRVTTRRELLPDSSAEFKSYSLNVTVFSVSVSALESHYASRQRSGDQFKYSRSGRYTFRGVDVYRETDLEVRNGIYDFNLPSVPDVVGVQCKAARGMSVWSGGLQEFRFKDWRICEYGWQEFSCNFSK